MGRVLDKKKLEYFRHYARRGHRIFIIQITTKTAPEPVFPEYADYTWLLVYLKAVPQKTFLQLATGNLQLIEKSILLIRRGFGINTAVIYHVPDELHYLTAHLKNVYGWPILSSIFTEKKSSRAIGNQGNRLRFVRRRSSPVRTVHKPVTYLISAIIRERKFFISKFLSEFPKISIIVVTYNNLAYTKLCLESIIENTEYPNFEVIIVDNGSTDATPEYLDSLQECRFEIRVIKNTNNRGFAPANNQGFEASTGRYIVFLNNDTIVTPGWLFRLYRHLINNPSAGMVGPVTNNIGNEAMVEVDYSDLIDINRYAVQRSAQFDGISFEIRVLALFCSMISRRLFQNIGGLDERYQIGMFEDDDLAIKISKAGLNCICAEDVFIHHFHGVSFKQLSDEENQRIFHENRKRFEEKWGISWQIHRTRLL